jgi:small subunit ribosomal protein S1
MTFDPTYPRREGVHSPENRDKEIGLGTPLKDDSLTPLSASPDQHRQVLGIGPGTPWKEADEAEPPAAPAQAAPIPAAPTPAAPTPAAAAPDAPISAAATPAAPTPVAPTPVAPPRAVAPLTEGEEEAVDEFARMFSQSVENETEPGEILHGRVLRIEADGVIVDVGLKSEGVIAREEFLDARGELQAKPGDEVQVSVQRRENADGLMVLSKRRVDKRLAWERVQAALANNSPVEGLLAAKCKGGYTVDLGGGVQAFLPGSQLDIRPVGDADAFLGKRYAFKVIKFNKDRGNIVLSRRNLLLDERQHLRAQAVAQLAPGRMVRGVVKTLTKFGAFVDLGGVDGLLRVEDMSWARVTNPRQVVQTGEEIEALVLSVSEETGKVALGLKQKSQDPWVNLETKYPVGSLVEGEVVSLAEFGAFLRLEEGIEGLLPVSELSWTKRIRHPQDVLKTGDRVRVKVLSLDPAAKKISLGLKQTEPDPFTVFLDSHKAGETLEGEVKSLTSYGAFVELAEGVSGLLHVSDLTWDASVRQPAELLKRGDKLTVKILEILPDKKKISLGLKQLTLDPWRAAIKRYPVGTVVRVKVLRNTKIGSFVQLEPGVEGLIHISQLERTKGAADPEPPAVGSELDAKVVKVSAEEHKIGLSIKEHLQDQEHAEVQKYLAPSGKRGVSLAELAGVDLEALKRRVGGDTADQA